MSFNSLLTDADLVAYWNGDANDDGTGDADDATGGTLDGTWVNGAAYGTPPWGSGKSFDLDDTANNYLSVSWGTALTEFAAGTYVNLDSQVGTDFKGALTSTTANNTSAGSWQIELDSSTNQYKIRCAPSNGGNDEQSVKFGSQTPSAWDLLGINVTPTTVQGFYNGAEGYATPDAFHDVTIDGSLLIGTNRNKNHFFNHENFHAFVFSRTLSASEWGEMYNGPEPTYTSGATLTVTSTDISGGVGTWDSQNNGTITYEWRVLDSGSNVVESGTGSTVSATGSYSADTYTLEVRASNDGGYDVGDSGDGYYQVASDTLSGSNTGQLSATAPSATASLAGTTTNEGAAAATAPSATASLAGTTTSQATLAATAPSATASMAGSTTNQATLTATAPSATASMIGSGPIADITGVQVFEVDRPPVVMEVERTPVVVEAVSSREVFTVQP